VHPFSKKVSAAFRAEATVDRSHFGVTWNAPLDTGGLYLGERVNISIVILAARQD
jgi:polyisoprenoid-binding protein YceI